ncbi:hypothetical protein B9Z19DRAFT_1082397 [Tuber borchii]|uniref:Uncharacterized protein n=1 Tax=Tuber borchii TaxID=42251 RepID=A0A2T6ZUN7_TUBBO|nr:hypothetical protein B9Z19DRAFT_1082397 [Tuber borchii]
MKFFLFSFLSFLHICMIFWVGRLSVCCYVLPDRSMIKSLDWREGEGKPTKTPFTPSCFSFVLSFLLSPLP